MPPPTRPICQHTYDHLETVRYTEPGGYNTKFVRIDRFFCTKCLDVKEKSRSGYHRDTPDWYRSGGDT